MSPTHWVLAVLILCTFVQLCHCLSDEFPDYADYESQSRSLKKKKKKLQCLLHLNSQRRSYGEERTLGLLTALSQFEAQHDEEDHHDDPCKDVFHGLFSSGGSSSGQSFQNRNQNFPYSPQSYVRQLNRLLRPVNRALRPYYRLVF